MWNDELKVISGGLTMADIEKTVHLLKSKFQLIPFFGMQAIKPGQPKHQKSTQNKQPLQRGKTFNCSDYINQLERKYLSNDEVSLFLSLLVVNLVIFRTRSTHSC